VATLALEGEHHAGELVRPTSRPSLRHDSSQFWQYTQRRLHPEKEDGARSRPSREARFLAEVRERCVDPGAPRRCGTLRHG
jgi:hypothetical protein